MKYIYIAGPYTGDEDANVSAAISLGDLVKQEGLWPFIPHLCHFWHEKFPAGYDDWMAYVTAWLQKCDAVLVRDLSPGVKDEIKIAKSKDIPVFFAKDWAKFLAWAKGKPGPIIN